MKFSLIAMLFIALGIFEQPTTPVYQTNTDLLESYADNHPTQEELEQMFDAFTCNLTYTYQQYFQDGCCIFQEGNCFCVDITVQGIYNHLCAPNLTDIWFESIFLCEQEPWSAVSPTIRVKVDAISACGGPKSCSGPVNVPLTMKYQYSCGPFQTCIGTYNSSVQIIFC